MDLLENSFLGSDALWPGRIARTNCAESKECRLNAIVKGELDARRNEVSIFIDIARIEPLFFILEVERMQDEIVSVPSSLLTPVLAVTAREDAAINNDVGHEEESEGVQERMRRLFDGRLRDFISPPKTCPEVTLDFARTHIFFDAGKNLSLWVTGSTMHSVEVGFASLRRVERNRTYRCINQAGHVDRSNKDSRMGMTSFSFPLVGFVFHGTDLGHPVHNLYGHGAIASTSSRVEKGRRKDGPMFHTPSPATPGSSVPASGG
ncbi:hypothetical protein HZH68_010679 [Vespula germanica]|uniref:Uncharacterized protein n=1 Tax=Vespula germanica TaxID=30212 RepID=A0A834N2X9_VESGE|nr:hypothetical protein HZH68_010679 [Vespula germanica]